MKSLVQLVPAVAIHFHGTPCAEILHHCSLSSTRGTVMYEALYVCFIFMMYEGLYEALSGDNVTPSVFAHKADSPIFS